MRLTHFWQLGRRPSDDVGNDESGKNCQDSKMKNISMEGGRGSRLI